MAAALNLPINPLDDLIEQLGGPDKVAEMTGRSSRIVRRNGTLVYGRISHVFCKTSSGLFSQLVNCSFEILGNPLFLQWVKA